jgi:hypothetical protein
LDCLVPLWILKIFLFLFATESESAKTKERNEECRSTANVRHTRGGFLIRFGQRAGLCASKPWIFLRETPLHGRETLWAK